MSTKKDKDLDLVDGLFHDLAVDEAEHGKLSAHDREALNQVAEASRAAALRARQDLLEQARKERLAAGKPSVPARILSMTRAAIVDRIRELEELFPSKLAVAHRQLEEVSDDDLRTLLADIEAQVGETRSES